MVGGGGADAMRLSDRLYQEALRHDERHAEAMMSLARLHMDREELDEARKQCTGLNPPCLLSPPCLTPPLCSIINHGPLASEICR